MLGTAPRWGIPQRSVKLQAKRFLTQFNDLGGLLGAWPNVLLKD